MGKESVKLRYLTILSLELFNLDIAKHRCYFRHLTLIFVNSGVKLQ